jgi:hypothetical protein
MSRKKNQTTVEPAGAAATAVEPEASVAPAGEPRATAEDAGQEKSWGPPYKAIFVSKDKGFEMGEDRRFKQRVFIFKEKPEVEILATLKDAGFIYRPAEKSWTIQATAATRELSDRLAQQFAGEVQQLSR